MSEETTVPQRPEGVPESARFEPEHPGYEWVVGDLDENGERHGPYKEFTLEGVLHGECTYVHGTIDGDNINYHPDGSVSSVGEWKGGLYLDTHYFRGPEDSPEPWPECGPSVQKVGFYSRNGKSNYTMKYFDQDDVEVLASGNPLPERPEGVSEDARFFEDHNFWVVGDIQRGTNAQVGHWIWWSPEGELQRKEERAEDGSPLEIEIFNGENRKEHKKYRTDNTAIFERKHHDNGKLFVERYYDSEKRKTGVTFWYDDGDLNHGTTWFWNNDGELAATREIKYPGYTAFEARRGPDGLRCEFYLSTGAKIIEGTLGDEDQMVGEWRMYNDDGELDVAFEPLDGSTCSPQFDGFTYNVGAALLRKTSPDIEAAADADFVKRVKEIDWATIESCYGDAECIPENLIAMTSQHRAVRSAAMGNIEAEILHQGTVYEATAKVLPFWIELLDHPNGDVADILDMLGWIGESASPWVAEAEDKDPDEPPEEGKWRIGILGSVEALQNGWEQISKFLDSDDQAVRSRVLALAKYANPESVRPQLETFAMNAPDPQMRAIAIQSIADLQNAEPSHLTPFFEDASKFVRTSAAISMAFRFGPGSDDSAVAILLDGLDEWEALASDYHALPFTDSHLVAMISLAVGSIRSEAAKNGLSKICPLSEVVDNMSAPIFGRGLLALSLGNGELPFAEDFALALTTLANSKKFYVFNVNAYEVLQSWNLPREPEEILELVESVTSSDDPQQAMHAFIHGE